MISNEVELIINEVASATEAQIKSVVVASKEDRNSLDIDMPIKFMLLPCNYKERRLKQDSRDCNRTQSSESRLIKRKLENSFQKSFSNV